MNLRPEMIKLLEENIGGLFEPQHCQTGNQLQEKNCKRQRCVEAKKMLLSNQWVTEEMKMEI